MKRTLLTLASLLTLSISSYAGDWGLDISYNSGGWGGGHYRRWVAPSRTVVVHRDYRPVVRHEVHYRYVRPVEPRGHWEWVETKEWVSGYNEKVWVPAEYQEMWIHAGRDSRGNEIPAHSVKVLVSEGHYESVWHEGYYQTVKKRVWVE